MNFYVEFDGERYIYTSTSTVFEIVGINEYNPLQLSNELRYRVDKDNFTVLSLVSLEDATDFVVNEISKVNGTIIG